MRSSIILGSIVEDTHEHILYKADKTTERILNPHFFYLIPLMSIN